MTFYHRRLLSFLIVSSWFASISSALHLPVERRTLKRSHSLGKRQMDNSTGFQETIVNSLSTSYFVNITVSGINFTLLMDTGSTDTAIVPASPEQVPDINSTGLPVFLPFAVGSFNGTVGFAPASLGPYEVPSQAIINVTTGNFPDVGAQGVMGLAFSSNTASVIDNAFNDTGMPLVEANLVANIIAHNPSLENYFTITLGRTNDSSAESADGVLTVGELIDELEEINTAPEVPQVPPPPGDLVGRWNLAVDGVTINGKSFPLQSHFNVTAPGTAVTILDTGYARPPLPPALAEAIYGQIPGAVLAPPVADPQFDGALNGTWLVPCSAVPPNVTFIIGGKSYPLHPLDITALITITRDVQELVNGTVCTGTFVSGSDALFETIGGLDMILGQPFLRNVYAKFNFGDRIIGAPSTVSPKNSSIQILSTTDLNSAIPDFVTSRQAALAASLPEIPPATVVSMLQNGQL